MRGRVLEKRAQDFCLAYRRKFGNEAVTPLCTVVSDVALLMQEYTQMAGVRPFGVALLFAGVENEGVFIKPTSEVSTTDNAWVRSVPHLFKVEPSGRCSEWKAAAVGRHAAEAESILRDRWDQLMDRDHALELALSVVLRCTPDNLTREDVDIAFVEAGNLQHMNSM